MKTQRIKKKLVSDQKNLFVACAALSQGLAQALWQAQHFRKIRYRFRGMRGTFERYGTDFAADAALSQGPVQIFAAGAALSQGQVQTSQQAQHFRKVRQVQHFRKVWYRFRGTRSAFASYGTDFAAGEVRYRFRGRRSSLRQAQHFRKR